MAVTLRQRVYPPADKGVYRGTNVTQLKLVGGDLTLGAHVTIIKKEQQLVLGKFWVNLCEQNQVKGEIPRSKLTEERETNMT